ncbi:hypothetical protein [Jannaschia donghaensis]|uniref:Uncharacterized protein n=1 Tax=Jannaschia donghaensis TaxID=420998 RepID=A0A0M6YJM4_9RHOB|nr:hypothetical protein [Jannaschia donghaensis]CTQ50150.1 hypothetical protein JDO7802_02168 [Jannaschia donghaensis]
MHRVAAFDCVVRTGTIAVAGNTISTIFRAAAERDAKTAGSISVSGCLLAIDRGVRPTATAWAEGLYERGPMKRHFLLAGHTLGGAGV